MTYEEMVELMREYDEVEIGDYSRNIFQELENELKGNPVFEAWAKAYWETPTDAVLAQIPADVIEETRAAMNSLIVKIGMGHLIRAMRNAGFGDDEMRAMRKAVVSGDFSNVNFCQDSFTSDWEEFQ